jgi:hypothetical protein
MTSTLSLSILGSVASLLAAIHSQENHDRKHNLSNIGSTPYAGAARMLHKNGKFLLIVQLLIALLVFSNYYFAPDL